MESELNGYEYTLMEEFDFNQPINATIIYDSDEDELNKKTNTQLPEKHDSDHQKAAKYLDMPSLEEHNSTAEFKMVDIVTGMIEKYMNETKKTCDTKSLKRKYLTKSNNTIKNKLKRKTNNMKELGGQHNERPLASPSDEPSGPQSNISNDISETKKTYDKKPPNRKSSTTTNDTMKKTNNVKELGGQHDERTSISSNNYKNRPVASFPTEPSGPPSTVSNDIRSQNSSCASNSPLNGQPILSASIKPKAEPIEDSDLSNDLSEEINNIQNTSTSSSTENSQAVSTSEDQPIQESWTSPNIASEGIGNTLDNSTSNSSTTNAHNGQPIFACIEVKADIIKDSIPQINVSYEITNQQHIFSTSNIPTNTDNRQSISAGIEQSVESVENPSISANDGSEEIRNRIDIKIGDQSNTSISILPPNTDTSCTFTNVSEDIRNPLNTAGSSSSTNTNNVLVSTNATSNIETQQNNDNSVTYAHLKPLLDTVSEHIILIWNKYHVIKGKCVQNFEYNEELRKLYYNYKIRLFDLSYSTVVNVILPRQCDRTFVKDFIDNTAALVKYTNKQTSSPHIPRQTIKEISSLYLEMINWVKNMKQRIASDSAFEREIMRQPLAWTGTNSNILPGIEKEYINPHSTHNHTYSIRPPETQRPPPWTTISNPPSPYLNNPHPPSLYTNNPPPPSLYTNNPHPPSLYTNNPPPPSLYTNNPPPPYTNTIPPQYNTMPPQTYVNNDTSITPEQTKAKSITHSQHQQLSTILKQKKNTKFNQRQQVTVAEVERRVANTSEGPRHDFHSANVTQINNSNNNNNINVSSNYTGGTYQHYQSTYFTALPNPNHAQSAHCINNTISANNSSYSRNIAESDYQKSLTRSLKSLILPNNSTSSQNHCYRANDASSQGINNYPNNAYLNQANNIQQESDRSSISRDSGFYSPRDFEQENSTSPLITHVTSLNPDAVNIIKGNCYVCGKNTNQKCIGCYATYYCSYECQNSDWRYHMTSCNSNEELRKLLCK